MLKFFPTWMADGFPWGSVTVKNCGDTKSVAERHGGSFRLLQERRDPEIPLPTNLREEDRAFFEPLRRVYCAPTFVAEIPGGMVANNGAVLDDTGMLCRDVSIAHGYKKDTHPLLHQSLSHVTSRAGRAAVIASRGADCYYHWMLDILPRLALLENVAYDSLLVTHSESFQKETLEMLGVLSRCKETPKYACRAHETLIVPSLPGYSGMATPESIAFLRKQLGRDASTGNRKLYISRGDAKKRKIIGEPALMDALKSRGFEICHLSGMPVSEQISLFASAGMVIAPHGASLTNTLFCKPGTPVIELFHPKYAHWCYWYLAALSGLDYHYHVPSSAAAVTHDHQFATADISIEQDKLLSLVETLSTASTAKNL